MADTIGAIGIPITADDSGLAKGVANATQYLTTFGGFVKNMAAGDATAGLTGIGSAIQGITSNLPGVSSLGSAFQALTSPIGMVAAALTGTYYAATKAIGSIARLQNEAKALGASVEGTQRFNYALAAFGASGEDVQSVLDKLRAKIGDLQSGDASATAAFQRLGLSMQQLQGMSLPEQFALIGDRLKEQGDSTIRASIAMDIFGKQWASVENLAMKGSDKFRAAGDQAERYGIVLSASQVAAMKKIADGGKQVTAAWGTIGTFFKNQIALLMAPVIDVAQPILMKIRDALQPVLNVVGKVMGLFGGVLGKVASVLGKVLTPIVDAVGYVFTAIDKIADAIGWVYDKTIGLVSGIGSWIGDKIGGAWDWLKDKAGGAWEWVKGKAGGVLSWIDEKSGGFFSWVGDKIGGAWDWMKDKAGKAWDWVKDKAQGAWEWMKNITGFGASDFDKQNQAIWDSMEVGPSMSAAAQSALSLAILDSNEALIEQAQTFGMSQAEIERWRLVQQGATDDMLAFHDEMQEVIAGYRLDEAVSSATRSLEEQVATFGMSSTEIQRWKLVQQGANDEQLAAYDAQALQLKVLQDEEKARTEELQRQQNAIRGMAAQFQQMMQAGQQMADSFKSPLQTWQDGIANVQELFAMGAIDLDTYDRQIAKLTEDLLAVSEIKLPQSPTAVQAGSSAGISAVLAARRQAEQDRPTDPMERLRQVQEQQRQLQQRQLDEARRMRELLEGAGEIAVFDLNMGS